MSHFSLPVRQLPRETFVTWERQQPDVPWQTFYRARNKLIDALEPFGSLGPLGRCVIDDGEEPVFDVGVHDPLFFIVDDWWYENQRWIRVETKGAAISTSLVQSVAERLPEGWYAEIAVGTGILFLATHEIGVDGPLFEGVQSVMEVVERCRSAAKSQDS